MSPDVTPRPTFVSLERARRRQHAIFRWLRPLGFAVVALVLIGGSRVEPRPGLSGDRLGILLTLVGVAVGVAGVLRTRRAAAVAQAPFFAVLVLCSTTLVWLQPNGPGFLAVFVVVAAAAMRMRGWPGAVVAALALVALPAAAVFGAGRAVGSTLMSELGVVAFYVLALLAHRLSEGQEQAEQLLAELEQSRETQAQAAAIAERQRLAREMHDVLAHTLSALAIQLEGTRLLAADKHFDPEVGAALERAQQLARAGLVEARGAIGMLRDDELPGPDRLEALARTFEQDTATHCAVEIAGAERELSSEARLTLYRVAQEALTNVRRHANPKRVELRLDYEPDGTRLTVEDFAESEPAAPLDTVGGYGLSGMRERAELLGGQLSARPTGSGFRVELWVPA